MPVLSSVEFWPATGFVDQPWCEEPELDAWVKTSRRVCEAYGAALAGHSLPAVEAGLRLMANASDDEDACGGDVVVNAFADTSSEGARIEIPSVVADLSPLVRARLVLDVIDFVLRRLAPARNWPLEAIDAIRQEVLDGGLGFWWSGREVASPDRRLSARTQFNLSDNGFGRVRVEIRDRTDEALIGASTVLVAYSTIEGFKRTSQSLHWVDGDHLTVDHFVDAFGIDRRSILIDVRRDFRPTPTVHAQVLPRQCVTSVTAPRIVLPPDPQPRIAGGSGGPMNDVPLLYQAATNWMFDHIPPALTAWWANSGLLELYVYYGFEGSKPSARLYRRGDDLKATLRRPMPDPAATQDPIRTAHQDVLTVLAAVRRRFKLPPHPDLPRPSAGDLDKLVTELEEAENIDEHRLDLEKLKDVLPPEAIALLREARYLDTD